MYCVMGGDQKTLCDPLVAHLPDVEHALDGGTRKAEGTSEDVTHTRPVALQTPEFLHGEDAVDLQSANESSAEHHPSSESEYTARFSRAVADLIATECEELATEKQRRSIFPGRGLRCSSGMGSRPRLHERAATRAAQKKRKGVPSKKGRVFLQEGKGVPPRREGCSSKKGKGVPLFFSRQENEGTIIAMKSKQGRSATPTWDHRRTSQRGVAFPRPFDTKWCSALSPQETRRRRLRITASNLVVVPHMSATGSRALACANCCMVSLHLPPVSIARTTSSHPQEKACSGCVVSLS